MWRRSVGFVVSALIAALLAIAVLSAPFVRHVWSRHAYARRLGVARLVSASSALPYRRVLPRVTPQFDYRPFRRVERGSIDSGEAELLESVVPFARTNSRDDDAPTLQGAGVAMLTAGEPAQACALLERALFSASGERSVVPAIARSNDARLLTDLAAAYYQRGVANNDAESTLSAIDVAARAMQLEPKFEVAAFNRALAIERMHAPDRAIAAWKEYLRLDDAEGWRAEARAHVGALEAQLRQVSTKTDLASHIENELLPAWGAAFLRGDAVMADSKLSEASAAAHELATCCGDDFYDNAVESAQDSARHDRRRALTLAAAYQRYQEGYALSRTDETTKSLPALEASRDALVSLGDIFAVKPWRLAAVSYALIGEHEKALHETDAALEYCQARPGCSSTVRAHLLWGRGLVFGRLGDPQRANAEFAEALHGFEAAHDTQNAASIHALIASNLIFLGATDDAWPHLMTAMRAADASGRMRRIYIAYTGATDAASTRHHWASARMFEDVIIASERREHNVVLLADSLLTRGQILAAVSPAEARRDFAEARQIATTISDERRRAKVLATAAISEAGVLAPQDAARSLTEALQYYDDVKDHYHVAEIYAKRAEEEEKSGMKRAAEGDYRHCIDELELERGSIAPADLRITSFTRSSSVFDEVIEHLWSSGRRADAFEMAEESRGREFARAASRTQFRLADAAHALRDGEVLVDYAVLPGHMLAWVIDARGTVTWVDSPVKAEQLQDAVDGLRDSFDAAIARLSALVWNPLSTAARGARRIIIVPNKALRAVPFAALRDPSTSRFLIEDHEIVIAPSAAAYSESVRRDAQLRQRDGAVVIAMSTRGDESRHLPRLEAGADEAAAVRDTYAGRSVVVDGMTPERFLAITRDAKIVHVIAHALSNAVHPEYASIVFDKGKQGGDLYADTIAKTSWPSTRVVFLSTCGIASPGAYNDVPLTLPESFLAAGVPIVLASMAPVDDSRASEFARIFHRQFAQSADAVAALRTAQLHFLNADRNNVKAWAFWTAIGGSS